MNRRLTISLRLIPRVARKQAVDEHPVAGYAQAFCAREREPGGGLGVAPRAARTRVEQHGDEEEVNGAPRALLEGDGGKGG